MALLPLHKDGECWLIPVSTISLLWFKGPTSQQQFFTAIPQPQHPEQTSCSFSWMCRQRYLRPHTDRDNRNNHIHPACVKGSETKHWSTGDSSYEEQRSTVPPWQCGPLFTAGSAWCRSPGSLELFPWFSSEILPLFPSLLCPFPRHKWTFSWLFRQQNSILLLNVK